MKHGHVSPRVSPPEATAVSRSRQLRLVQTVVQILVDLRLSAAIVEGQEWYSLHQVPTVITFEEAHSATGRWKAHNPNLIAQARGERRPVLGEHLGFFDLFVPMGDAGGGESFLVAGPFSLARPTSHELLARWRSLTGNHARASDPEFLHYLAMTLSTTTFGSAELEAFKRLCLIFARFFKGEEKAQRFEAEVEDVRAKLFEVRAPERMWEAVQEMLDDKTSRMWQGPIRRQQLSQMGAKRVPEHAIVGLLLGRVDEADPIDDLLRRDAFQRACVALCLKHGEVLSGRVGHHGVVLLPNVVGGKHRVRSRLTNLAEQARAVAKRHGLKLHVGVNALDDQAALPARYRIALSAAERALTQGLALVQAEPETRVRTESPLGELRRKLNQAVIEEPGRLGPRFDGYLEALVAHAGYRLEPTRAHLEAGVDQLTETLRSTHTLDDKSLGELRKTLARTAAGASTIGELAAAYRQTILDIEAAISRPKEARQDRSIRRALEYIREHLGEPLTRPEVARAAGFAPNYFSKVFQKSERTTFEKYTLRLRLERAQQMLGATDLAIERICQLCGFRTRNHFHRAFKQALGVTPLAYRAVEKRVHAIRPTRPAGSYRTKKKS